MTAKRTPQDSSEPTKGIGRRRMSDSVSDSMPDATPEELTPKPIKKYKDFSRYAEEIEENWNSTHSTIRKGDENASPPSENEPPKKSRSGFGAGVFNDAAPSNDFEESEIRRPGRRRMASDLTGFSRDYKGHENNDDRPSEGDDSSETRPRARWNPEPYPSGESRESSRYSGGERPSGERSGGERPSGERPGYRNYRNEDRDGRNYSDRNGGGNYTDRGNYGDRRGNYGDRDRNFQDRNSDRNSNYGDRDRNFQDRGNYGDRGGYGNRDNYGDRNRDNYGDRNRGNYGDRDRNFQDRNSDRNSNYGDRNRGNFSDQQGGGYRPGGYRNEGGYQEDRNGQRPYRQQERFYRRHFRDGNDVGSTPSSDSGGYQPRYSHYSRRYQNPGYPGDMLEHMEPENAPRGKYGEPLSLAEELAACRFRGEEDAPTLAETVSPEELQQLGATASEGRNYFEKLQGMTAQELLLESRKQNSEGPVGEFRQNFIYRVLREKIQTSGLMYGEGTLEILPEEFGFLRNPEFHYLSCPDDIYISPSQIRRFGLRNGSIVSGQIRPPKEKERYFALLRIEAINEEDPSVLTNKPFFDDLTAMHPNERIVLETDDGDMNTRVVDMIIPVGFGQRGLIVSPPRAGKTILMQKMARSVLANYPNAYVFMLLIDERPEEVTDMERQVKGPRCEVISSTFDEPPSRHIQVSEMVLDKAKRMVEYGKDVVIFLDSMTRLARAWNNESPNSGKTLSGGIDAGALQSPKKFFGAARKIEEGGSLTIIATALVDTGSRMDEVIFEEFKGTGNLEISLDRSLVDKRIWPAIDITRSGTRREEMILDPEEHKRISALRRILNDMNPPDAMEFLTGKLSKTKKNAEFLMGLNIR